MRHVTLPAGAVLFRDGDACEAYTLVLSGRVRVQKVSESGRQIVLYRVEPGQTCVLTTNALMAALPYGAEGIAETAVEAVVVPGATFQALMGASAVFRHFVFTAYATRISDLLMLIDEVAFGRIDARLAHLLLTRADVRGIVMGTHLELATELGSAREVISRQLKEFERRGWVSAARGQVRITDRAALARVEGRDHGPGRREGRG
jgi:CRP/FNR family transcriptional regulator